MVSKLNFKVNYYLEKFLNQDSFQHNLNSNLNVREPCKFYNLKNSKKGPDNSGTINCMVDRSYLISHYMFKMGICQRILMKYPKTDATYIFCNINNLTLTQYNYHSVHGMKHITS